MSLSRTQVDRPSAAFLLQAVSAGTRLSEAKPLSLGQHTLLCPDLQFSGLENILPRTIGEIDER